jgi:hypothetical protein
LKRQEVSEIKQTVFYFFLWNEPFDLPIIKYFWNMGALPNPNGILKFWTIFKTLNNHQTFTKQLKPQL